MNFAAMERGMAFLAAVETGGDLDDLGALVTGMRHMLEGGAPLGDTDARALYCLAAMAEKAWRRLDDAMTGPSR